MIILAINCGSSSLRFQAIDFKNKEENAIKESQIVSGIVDRIGGQGSIKIVAENKGSQPHVSHEHVRRAEARASQRFGQLGLGC